jgi:hypothetical protein
MIASTLRASTALQNFGGFEHHAEHGMTPDAAGGPGPQMDVCGASSSYPNP